MITLGNPPRATKRLSARLISTLRSSARCFSLSKPSATYAGGEQSQLEQLTPSGNVKRAKPRTVKRAGGKGTVPSNLVILQIRAVVDKLEAEIINDT